MSAARRLATEARDFVELVLLPALAAVLPWPLCFRIFRLASWLDVLYAAECREALRYAEALGWVRGDRRRWLRARRLVTLVDHADFYLSRTRSDRWLGRHVRVEGEWPAPDKAAILCTFHWGAGMWALRHLGARSMRAHAIVAPQVAEAYPGQTVRWLYARARVRSVAAALRTEPIVPSHSSRSVLRTLHRGEQIAAAVDVPADTVAASEPIPFLGAEAHIPRGLLRVAAHAGIPVTVYLTEVRLSDGRRVLHIHPLGVRDSPERLMAEVFAFLERAIEAEPAAWHFWSVAPRFLALDASIMAAPKRDEPPAAVVGRIALALRRWFYRSGLKVKSSRVPTVEEVQSEDLDYVPPSLDLDYAPTFAFTGYLDGRHAGWAECPQADRILQHRIFGWLRRADALKLYELAALSEGNVLELGTHQGLSTHIMAGAIRAFGGGRRIDSFDLDPEAVAGARSNLAAELAEGLVTITIGEAAEQCRRIISEGRRYGFVFVDHSHHYGPMCEICRLLPTVVKPGGFVLFHDFTDPRSREPSEGMPEPDFGVLAACRECLSPMAFRYLGAFGCSGLFRRTGHAA